MKNKDLIKHNGITAFKSLLGAVPYVGTALNELFFESRSRLKQKRINDFVKSFSDYLETVNESEISLEKINQEEFGDFFENLMMKVSKTSSTEKINAFRNILADQLIKPKKTNYSELIIDIINNLIEQQILIIDSFYFFSQTYVEKRKELKKLNNQKTRLKSENIKTPNSFIEKVKIKHEIKKINERQVNLMYKQHLSKKIKSNIDLSERIISDHEKYFNCQHYDIGYSEYIYLKHDLVNKGILIDKGISDNFEPLELLEITSFGKEIYNFIKYTPVANTV